MVYIAHEAIALRLGDVGIVFSFLLFVLKWNKYLLHLSGGGIQMSNEIVHYAFNLVPVVWVIVALVEQADP